MEWIELKESFLEHQIYLRKMKIYNYFSLETFKNIPENLSEKNKSEFMYTIRALEVALHKALDDMDNSNDSNTDNEVAADLEISVESRSILLDLVFMFGDSVKKENSKEALDQVLNLEKLILFQSLVMNYARIDAFLNDVFEAICKVKPEIMLSSLDETQRKNEGINTRNISWKEVISFKSYDKLIDYMVEDFIYKLGLQSLEKRFKFIKNILKIEIPIEDSNMKFMYEGEKFRHCIVHRGGSIDERLIAAIDRTDLKVGQSIPIDQAYVNKNFRITEIFMYNIFKAISIKYFEKTEKEIEKSVSVVKK